MESAALCTLRKAIAWLFDKYFSTLCIKRRQDNQSFLHTGHPGACGASFLDLAQLFQHLGKNLTQEKTWAVEWIYQVVAA